MDIEFHYYITYIIALRANFSPEEAYKIAYSCQHTDINQFPYTIAGKDGSYENYISQSENITKPKEEMLRVYPLFHFCPGTLDEVVAYHQKYPRRDGKLHSFNTVPGNKNAKALMDTALKSNNLYRIGIASHLLADTYSHQNFVGFKDEYNAMKGTLEKLLPRIGHTEAMFKPDWQAYSWTDERFVSQCSGINNKERFLEASGCIFDAYCVHTSLANADSAKSSLLKDLGDAIGRVTTRYVDSTKRIGAYKSLAGCEFKEYRKDDWFDSAIRYEADPQKIGVDDSARLYFWEDQDKFSDTDWYQFQEAVKAHQKEAEKVLQPVLAMTAIPDHRNW